MMGPAELSIGDGGARAAIRLFHPKGNIITAEMLEAVSAALERLRGEAHLKLLTIEGAADDFSFGASIPEHAPGAIDRLLPQAHAVIERLLEAPVTTAALVRGRCLGGGFELALACDFIFAEEGAVFGLPEIALGVFPPAAAALLPARVGAARSTAAILTGASIPAEDWKQAGLVTSVSRKGELTSDVDRWFAGHVASRSAEALRHAVAAARMDLRQRVGTLLPHLERLYLESLMQTDDAREGVAAFLGKRPPHWSDR